ncbi:hypothetical protein BH20ACT23_BH20ACT23_23310 [soil metagenome]
MMTRAPSKLTPSRLATSRAQITTPRPVASSRPVSDVGGGVYNDEGLDLVALERHLEDSLSLADFGGGESVTNEELLELECDILIPAAVHGVINTGNAGDIKAP